MGKAMKILIVEDERRLAQLLKKGLEENGFVVDLAPDGVEGLYMAETYPYDALLLDIMLPEMDGLSVLQSLRTRVIEVPVLLVTARGDLEDRIKGLNLGADDYIAKPFDLEELIARLRSVIRRSKGRPSPLIKINDLTIDTNAIHTANGGNHENVTQKSHSIRSGGECRASSGDPTRPLRKGSHQSSRAGRACLGLK